MIRSYTPQMDVDDIQELMSEGSLKSTSWSIQDVLIQVFKKLISSYPFISSLYCPFLVWIHFWVITSFPCQYCIFPIFDITYMEVSFRSNRTNNTSLLLLDVSNSCFMYLFYESSFLDMWGHCSISCNCVCLSIRCYLSVASPSEPRIHISHHLGF